MQADMNHMCLFVDVLFSVCNLREVNAESLSGLLCTNHRDLMKVLYCITCVIFVDLICSVSHFERIISRI